MNLKEKTKKLVRESPLTAEQIADGAGVSVHWVNSFRKQAGPVSPSIDFVQAVYNFLSKKGRT